MNAAERIQHIAEFHDIRSYLEVGVQTGHTFNALSFPLKVGVDPQFMFDRQAVQAPNTLLFEMTSDQFFLDPRNHLTFDLIYLDGLHRFQQTLRDFINAMAHSTERTIVIIDDVFPGDVFSALPDVRDTYRFREMAQPGTPDRSWHGDVYKVVCAIHDLFPKFSYCTVDWGYGNPQTFCWRAPRPDFRPRFDSLERIERMSYFDLLDNLDVLNLMPEEDALGMLRAFSETTRSIR